MDELLAEFIAETSENLEHAAPALAALEADAASPGVQEKLFRRIHTIKSSCGFLKLTDLEAVAEKAEALLARLRDNNQTPEKSDLALIEKTLKSFQDFINAIGHENGDAQNQPSQTLPLADSWKHLPPLVAGLNKILDKKSSLQTSGGDIEISYVSARVLKECLTHLVRNALAHGIEAPQARLKNGKPESGTITIKGEIENGQLLVQAADDGAGLALASKDFDLIFSPGFSTAPEATAISGRGVGLDAVRELLQNIGGSITVASTPGKITVFSISIPYKA